MHSPRILFTILALFLFVALPTQCFADDYSWSDVFAGVGLNGYVAAITSVGGVLVVGGNFDAVGPIAAPNVAMWDGTSWQPMGDPGWSETMSLGTYNGEVYGHGFLGPDIVKWDGANWISIATLDFTGYNTNARAFVPYQGKLYIGGDGQMRVGDHFGIFTYDGSAIDSVGVGFDPSTFGLILDMVVYQGDLYVTGWFDMTADSIVTSGIARWDGTTWSPVEGRSTPGGPLHEGIHNGGYSGDGYALAVWDDKLVIAGAIDLAGNLAVSNICTWDAVTLMWEDVGGGSPEYVRDAAAYGDVLCAGGPNTAFGGTPMYLGQWDGTSWSSAGGDLSSSLLALHEYNGMLAIGGHFRRAGDAQAEHLALWNGTDYFGKLVPGGKGMDERVNAMDVYDGKLIVGGDFEYAGMKRVDHVAAWDGLQWSDLDGGANDHVECVLADDGDLIVSGEFTEIGGVAADYVARWDGSSWYAYGTGIPDAVTAMCMHNGELHVGGQDGFDGFLKRWDGATWHTIALEQYNGMVRALASYAGDLVVASSFWVFPDFYGDVARWDGADWLPLPSSHGTINDSGVEAFFHHNGDLYIGGHFADLGGDHPGILWTTLRTGRWDGTTLHRLEPTGLTYPPGPTNGVDLNSAYAYAYYDGKMFIAGSPDYRRGAIWSSDLVDPWEVVCGDVSSTVYAMVPYQGALFIGGRFSEVGTSRIELGQGTTSSYIGYLRRDVTGIEPPSVVHELVLSQNHPNPFNPTTTIRYEIPPGGADISLIIYDIKGRTIRTLASSYVTEGPKTATWDGRNDSGQPVASGLYLYRLTSGSSSLTRKMMFLK